MKGGREKINIYTNNIFEEKTNQKFDINMNKNTNNFEKQEYKQKPQKFEILKMFTITDVGLQIKTNVEINNKIKQIFEIINKLYEDNLLSDRNEIKSNRYQMIEESEIDIESGIENKTGYILDTKYNVKSSIYDLTNSNHSINLYCLCNAFNQFVDLYTKK